VLTKSVNNWRREVDEMKLVAGAYLVQSGETVIIGGVWTCALLQQLTH